MDRVFISYRRSDAGFVAAQLEARLAAELDADVFMDLQSILPGEDWEQEISAALQTCAAVVVVLGREWAGPLAEGARRIDDEGDSFRLELERALQADAAVIPVLIGDARLPSIAELPAGLRRLVELQAIRVDYERLEHSMAGVVAAIRRALDARAESALGPSEALDVYRSGFEWERPREAAWPHELDSGAVGFQLQADAIRSSPVLKLAVDAARASGRPLLLIGASDRD